MIPQHSSKSFEHFTPSHVVELSRTVLGGIDLDPCSCEEANRTIRATHIISLPDDGLLYSWPGRVFVNPPGGVLTNASERKYYGTASRAAAWWCKLVEEYLSGNTVSAIFIGFTLEILRTTQHCQIPLACVPVCFPAKRLSFGGSHPTHANVIAYLGNEKEKFRKTFEPLGVVRV